MSDQFYHLRVRLGNLFQDYGVQFSSIDSAAKFLTVLDSCLAKVRERASSVERPTTPTPGTASNSNSPIKQLGSNTWNPSARPTQVKRASTSFMMGKDSVSKAGPLLTGQSIGSLKMIAGSFEQQALRFIQGTARICRISDILGAHEFVFSQQINEMIARKLSRQDIWDSLQVVMYIVSGEHFGEFLKKEVPQLVEFLYAFSQLG